MNSCIDTFLPKRDLLQCGKRSRPTQGTMVIKINVTLDTTLILLQGYTHDIKQRADIGYRINVALVRGFGVIIFGQLDTAKMAQSNRTLSYSKIGATIAPY